MRTLALFMLVASTGCLAGFGDTDTDTDPGDGYDLEPYKISLTINAPLAFEMADIYFDKYLVNKILPAAATSAVYTDASDVKWLTDPITVSATDSVGAMHMYGTLNGATYKDYANAAIPDQTLHELEATVELQLVATP